MVFEYPIPFKYCLVSFCVDRCPSNSGQKSLTLLIRSFSTVIQLILKNREIEKIKRYVIFEPATTKHLRNRMRKENCRNAFKLILINIIELYT